MRFKIRSGGFASVSGTSLLRVYEPTIWLAMQNFDEAKLFSSQTSNKIANFLLLAIERLRVAHNFYHNSLENFPRILKFLRNFSFLFLLRFSRGQQKYTKAGIYFWIHEIKEEKLHKQEGKRAAIFLLAQAEIRGRSRSHYYVTRWILTM